MTVKDEIELRIAAISVFKDVAQTITPLTAIMRKTDDVATLKADAAVFFACAETDSRSVGEWIKKLVLLSDNPFSRAAAKGERISRELAAEAKTELDTFKILSICDYALSFDFAPKLVSGGFDLSYERLYSFYEENGCGALASGNTFSYSKSGFATVCPDNIGLSDLKNYAEEKAEIVRNTQNFVDGRPAFHTLLYGDCGTGKSSTVRAVAHEFKDRLKLIELAAGDVELLPELFAELSGLKQKYIIFIDDLCFDEADKKAEGFKAALEGSTRSVFSSDCLVYCTSNRRHILKETDDRSFRHASDERQAALALFDRFGLVITYLAPDKQEFIDILRQIITSRGIKWREEYAGIAELAALEKGGRSPRTAKRIADLIESDIKAAKRHG